MLGVLHGVSSGSFDMGLILAKRVFNKIPICLGTMYCENWSLYFAVLHYISVQEAVVSIVCYEVTKRAVRKRSLE